MVGRDISASPPVESVLSGIKIIANPVHRSSHRIMPRALSKRYRPPAITGYGKPTPPSALFTVRPILSALPAIRARISSAGIFVEIAGAGKVNHELWGGQLQTLERHEPFHEFIYRFENAQHRQLYVSSERHADVRRGCAFLGYRGLSSDITDEYVARHQARAASPRCAKASAARAHHPRQHHGGYLIMLTPDGLIRRHEPHGAYVPVRGTRNHRRRKFHRHGVVPRRAGARAQRSGAGLAGAGAGTPQHCELAINDMEKGRRLVDFIFPARSRPKQPRAVSSSSTAAT